MTQPLISQESASVRGSMLVDSLELVPICSMVEPQLWFPGKASILKRFEAKWNSSQGGPRPALTAGFLHFQSLPLLLVPCQPEGFRKCFRRGESSEQQLL